MPAGRLHEKFGFEKRADTVDGYGNTRGAWVEQFQASTELRYFRGVEKAIDAASTGTQKVILKVRRSAVSKLVDTAWRGVDKRSGKTFNIRAVEPEVSRRFIEFIAETGVNDG